MSRERSRREFLKQSAALTALSAGDLVAPRRRPRAPPRRSRDDVRPRTRRRRGRHQDLQRHPLRREHRGRGPLPPARQPGRMDGRARRARLWPERAAARTGRRAHGLRPRSRSGESAARGRGLPRAQRLDAGSRRRPPAAGAVLVPRRRVRRRAPARHPSPTAPTSRAAATSWWFPINHRLNVLGFTHLAELGGSDFAQSGRRRHARHRACAPMGPRQHRGVRRRRRQRHDLRPVGRRP